MNIFSSTSLTKKLTVSAIALMALSITLISIVVYLSVISFGENVLKSELNEKSSFIEKAFIEPIWSYDSHQINEIGNSLLQKSSYTYISAFKIETSAHEVLFEKGQGEVKTFAEVEGLPYTETKQISVFKGEQKIAVISVAMTNDGYIAAFRNKLIIILVASLSLLLMFSQIVSYYFDQILTKPLGVILKQVKHIEKEEYLKNEVTDLPDELAAIARALNQAGSIIEKRNIDIKYYTDDLEKLVKERTAELENQAEKNLSNARLAAVGEMAADVAHEINNPLTVIDLNVNRIKKIENNPEILKSIEKIQSMVQRISKIIKGLKSLSRDGHSDPMVPFLIYSMVEDVKMLVEMKIKSHDIKFDVKLEHMALSIEGREVQISQVLVNLIGNAVDAVVLLEGEKWVTLEVTEVGNNINFIVTDSGKGIPDELKEKIMRPFFTTKELNKGTGLGLSISKNIIEEHGGTMIINDKHPNTQFIFTIPKAAVVKLTA